jgi:hypothetical protein
MALANQRKKRISPFWVIWLPLSVGSILALILFSFTIFSTSSGNAQIALWSQMAIVYIAFVIMLIGLIPLCLLIISIVGIKKVSKRMPKWFEKANSFSRVHQTRIQRSFLFIDKSSITIGSTIETLKSAIRFLIRKVNHKND